LFATLTLRVALTGVQRATRFLSGPTASLRPECRDKRKFQGFYSGISSMLATPASPAYRPPSLTWYHPPDSTCWRRISRLSTDRIYQ